jgi:outer membrane protein
LKRRTQKVLSALLGLGFTLLAGAPRAGYSVPADSAVKTLSLKDALDLAFQKHPRIIAADLQVSISRQTLRETRAAFFPTINADATAVGTPSERNQIISTGNPQVSSSYEREADSITITQLITDFGRTANLAASSKLHSHAQEQGALATRAQIELAVKSAYFSALQAQSVMEVARQTVETRQLLFDRVNEMASNNLKSDLDVSFADVDLEDSKLLLADADNDLQGAFANLANLLAEPRQQAYQLKDEPLPARPTPELWQLTQTALSNRPDVVQLRLERDAAKKFAHAERDLNYPTISAAATAGVLPVHNEALGPNYAAAGVTLRLPIFNGWLFSARKSEANLRAGVAEETLKDAEDNVIRDVRVAAANRSYAVARLDLTAKLLASANKAFDLAQERYQVGSASIIELSQAQLNLTEARINQAKAAFEFHVRDAILNYQIGENGVLP